MSKLENEVKIAGTLGRDAEFKTFGSGKTLVKFSINHPKGKKRDDDRHWMVRCRPVQLLMATVIMGLIILTITRILPKHHIALLKQ